MPSAGQAWSHQVLFKGGLLQASRDTPGLSSRLPVSAYSLHSTHVSKAVKSKPARCHASRAQYGQPDGIVAGETECLNTALMRIRAACICLYLEHTQEEVPL